MQGGKSNGGKWKEEMRGRRRGRRIGRRRGNCVLDLIEKVPICLHQKCTDIDAGYIRKWNGNEEENGDQGEKWKKPNIPNS
jgi:hypothetical protein